MQVVLNLHSEIFIWVREPQLLQAKGEDLYLLKCKQTLTFKPDKCIQVLSI